MDVRQRFDARESRTEAGMVTTEPAEVTASETRPPGFRIRWGWFLGCIASGLVAIVVGWFVAAPAGRAAGPRPATPR